MTRFPIFAAVDGLIVMVIIAIISALSSWAQKQRKKQQGNTPPGEPRPATGTSEESAVESWENELKRLLSGETVAEPPPPPPVVIAREPAPPPLPPPRVVVRPKAPLPVVAKNYATRDVRPAPAETELVVTPPAFSESRTAYAAASQLDQTVSVRLEQVTKQPIVMTRVKHRERPAEVRDAVAMLRQPRTARQAIIVSQIFGAPRSLEPLSW